jgi:hypothetical protein
VAVNKAKLRLKLKDYTSQLQYMAAALEGARQLTKDWDEDIPVSFESAIIHLGGAAGNLKTVIDRMTNERNE